MFGHPQLTRQAGLHAREGLERAEVIPIHQAGEHQAPSGFFAACRVVDGHTRHHQGPGGQPHHAFAGGVALRQHRWPAQGLQPLGLQRHAEYTPAKLAGFQQLATVTQHRHRLKAQVAHGGQGEVVIHELRVFAPHSAVSVVPAGVVVGNFSQRLAVPEQHGLHTPQFCLGRFVLKAVEQGRQQHKTQQQNAHAGCCHDQQQPHSQPPAQAG